MKTVVVNDVMESRGEAARSPDTQLSQEETWSQLEVVREVCARC